MLRVGLTGNIGSGKSIVAAVFGQIGIPVFHADEMSKTILDKPEFLQFLSTEFKEDITDFYGKADRKKIASIVFSDRKKLKMLNDFIHPAVIIEFEEWMNKHLSFHYILMESAILFETGYFKLFHKTIVVMVPEEIRLQRVMHRDHCTEKEVRKRFANQIQEEEQAGKADFIIQNNNEKLVVPQILKIHEELLHL